MTFPVVRSEPRRRELDRKQWAGLDKISFDIVALGDGEAYVGPFLFGRGYDAPPIFAYSMFTESFGQFGVDGRYEFTINFEGIMFQGYSVVHQTPEKASPPTVTLSGVATFGLVTITMGVADWITDDRNMYVGANLWIVAPEFGKGFG